jgi:hypothetical protein
MGNELVLFSHIYPSAFGHQIGMFRRPSKFLREIGAQMLVGFCTESVKGARQNTPPLPSTTSLQEDPSPQLYRGRSEGWSTTDEEKPQLSSRSPSPDYTVGEARLPTIPWGPVGDQLEEEMDPSTTYWRTTTSMDLQEDPSPLPGDLRIDHHRRLDAANQVWQGPYWAVRTQNRIPIISRHKSTQIQHDTLAYQVSLVKSRSVGVNSPSKGISNR